MSSHDPTGAARTALIDKVVAAMDDADRSTARRWPIEDMADAAIAVVTSHLAGQAGPEVEALVANLERQHADFWVDPDSQSRDDWQEARTALLAAYAAKDAALAAIRLECNWRRTVWNVVCPDGETVRMEALARIETENAALRQQLDEAERRAERSSAERRAVLDAFPLTDEKLNASEWILRTSKAEAEAATERQRAERAEILAAMLLCEKGSVTDPRIPEKSLTVVDLAKTMGRGESDFTAPGWPKTLTPEQARAVIAKYQKRRPANDAD